MATSISSPLLHSKEKINGICKHCQKKVVNKVECTKCEKVFHPSCLKQANESKKGNCKHVAGHQDNENQSDLVFTEEIFLKEENKLLRSIIQDKDTIINDKEIVISLMNDKIALLEQKLAEYNHNNNLSIPLKKTKETGQNQNLLKKDTLKQTKKKENSINESLIINLGVENSKVQGDSILKVGPEITQPQSEQKTNENLMLAETDYDENQQDFQVVTRRKRRHNMGNGEGNKDFHGKNENNNKKIWMFVSRVPDSVTEENIEKYIKEHTKSDNVCIKKLKTQNVRKDNQSFMIGVEPHLKELVYEPNFWPKRILYNRFNFKLGQHFLKEKPEDEETQTNQPRSFLGI